MALTSSNAAKQLSDQNSQGTVFGASASDTIGFYGAATPVARTTVSSKSMSSGALASSLAHQLNALGLTSTVIAP
ncbi:MAG: hypothetical protein E4H28_07695 [Gemmatimonadales bacterium]|nr:MAG: hypothetical protein E4H28_07695 [Gemmatimonadales bacterium]